MQNEKKNMTQKLIEIMGELEYLPGEKCLITQLDYNGNTRMIAINSKEFKAFLKSESLKRYGNVAKDKDIDDAVAVFAHEYKMKYDRDVDYAVRIYQDKDKKKLYYDLANNRMEYVVIDADNGINIEKMDYKNNSKFMFVRGNTIKAQVVPMRTNGNIPNKLNYLDKYLNLSKDEIFLLKIWLVASLYPEVRAPIPFFIGGAGTGKSSMIGIINELIDPSTNALRNWDESTHKDLAIDFRYAWNVNYDNISKITQKRSDMLCQTVTGGSMTFRQLYEDDKQINFELRRRITLSSIKKIKLSSDLAQRVLFFYPQVISDKKRIAEEDFYALFNEHKDEILGELFELLRYALGNFSSYKREHFTNYRLSSFYLFGQMIAERLDKKKGKERFRKIMDNQLREQLYWNTEKDRKFYEVLIYAMENYYSPYDASIKTLYECLCELISEDEDCPVKDSNVIPVYDSFSKTIHIYEDNLRKLGYEVEYWHKGKNKEAMITITPICEDEE